MQTARNRGRHSSSELVDVAIRHYELGETVEALAADRGVDQSTIRRWLSRAKRDGIIQTLVVPPLSDEDRTRLTQDVRYVFELEDVVLVPGREDLLDTSTETAAKEALVMTIAQAAARYLEDHLTNKDILLIPWGRMASYVTRQIRAPRPLPGLTVVPMAGVFGVDNDPFEANTLASSLASEFDGHSLVLPAPTVVDKSICDVIEALPLVRRVVDYFQRATMAIVTIASAGPERSTMAQMRVLTVDAVKDLVARGVVGEIASHWWFDRQGRVIDQREIQAIGLGLDGLSKMVKRRAKVIAVVGASREKIMALRVALNSKLVNVLITDHKTAELLLFEQ